jgi:hypothetical protein
MRPSRHHCRADSDDSQSWLPWVPVVASVLFVGGFSGAIAFLNHMAVSHDLEHIVQFSLWKTLLAALTGFAAVSSLYCCIWLTRLVRLCVRARAPTVLSWFATVVAIQITVFSFLFLGAANAQASIDKTLAIEARPITLVVGLCQVPGLVTFLALRFLATGEPNWQESGVCRLRMVRRLRSELRRILALFGAFLTLLVITTGLRRRALLARNPDQPIPPEEVLIYGLLFAVMLGLFYLVAASAIDRRAERILEEFAPLPDPSDPAMSDQLRRRADLSTMTGNTDTWATFETTVVIAAPLLTALIGISTGA